MLIRTTLLLFLIIPALVHSQSVNDVVRANPIKFSVANLGINVEGSFSEIDAKIEFSLARPEASSFDIRIPTKTINTGISLRDKHLKNETYLDAEKYPEIHFVSNQIRQLGNGKFEIKGMLAIKNIAKEIAFPFQVTKIKESFRFTGTFKINRRDFNVGKNSLTMSDYVTVEVNVIAPANLL